MHTVHAFNDSLNNNTVVIWVCRQLSVGRVGDSNATMKADAKQIMSLQSVSCYEQKSKQAASDVVCSSEL